MNFTTTPIAGLVVIEPKIWRDNRGEFLETYNEDLFKENGVDQHFVQDNQSLSQRGSLRGLHAQASPNAQGKLVRVISGRVMDVAVDIRTNSPTFGQTFHIELNAADAKMLWIPVGFLHGFIALEDHTIFAYKVTAKYDKASEIGVRYDDPAFNIQWPLGPEELVLSEKDLQLPLLKDIENPF
ncbi:dTDP-4-dehydrorhamnose 3,5-epimerase [Olivibacter ginsenosidimutans]|uniref:dTDP-4-dehydrorhamnose 3,5-epimerase n=1 Tax=Olivibacter ginsenosidimutans TaxID=1176537 RepID=A0ABP9ARV3_9SPHI